MILVIGQHEDISSDKVCSWLNYYNKKFVRVNDRNNNIDLVDIVLFTYNESRLKLRINDCTYNFDDFDLIWCRRGHPVFSIPPESSLNIKANIIPCKIDQHLSNEIETLNKYLEFTIENKQHINSPGHYNSNKLITLFKAKKAGLKVPETIITQNNKELLSFVGNNGKCITKNIQDNLSYHDNNFTFGHSTMDVSIDLSNTDSFFYSLFQKKRKLTENTS